MTAPVAAADQVEHRVRRAGAASKVRRQEGGRWRHCREGVSAKAIGIANPPRTIAAAAGAAGTLQRVPGRGPAAVPAAGERRLQQVLQATQLMDTALDHKLPAAATLFVWQTGRTAGRHNWEKSSDSKFVANSPAARGTRDCCLTLAHWVRRSSRLRQSAPVRGAHGQLFIDHSVQWAAAR